MSHLRAWWWAARAVLAWGVVNALWTSAVAWWVVVLTLISAFAGWVPMNIWMLLLTPFIVWLGDGLARNQQRRAARLFGLTLPRAWVRWAWLLSGLMWLCVAVGFAAGRWAWVAGTAAALILVAVVQTWWLLSLSRIAWLWLLPAAISLPWTPWGLMADFAYTARTEVLLVLWTISAFVLPLATHHLLGGFVMSLIAVGGKRKPKAKPGPA